LIFASFNACCACSNAITTFVLASIAQKLLLTTSELFHVQLFLLGLHGILDALASHFWPVQALLGVCTCMQQTVHAATPSSAHVLHATTSKQHCVAVVVSNFQDLHISVHAASNNSSSTALHEQVDHGRPALAASGGASVMSLTSYSSHRVAVEKKKLAIILVGLPGRGKTFLCNKLRCYLNW